MQVFENYHLPTTVHQALALLAQYDGHARVVAGGTDLLVDTQAEYYEGHRPHFDALVDVTKIAGAGEIRADKGFIEIGCGVTHTQIVTSPLIQKHATALAEACFVVGGPQVRNVATLCGNVAHALPAADGTVALMALDAEAAVARQSSDGAEIVDWVPLAALFKGPGQSSIDSTRELLTAIRFRSLGAGEASAFERVMRPQGVALPILGMATRVRVTSNGGRAAIEDVAISAGPVAPVPYRAFAVEEFLRGKTADADVMRTAAEMLLASARLRTSAHRATKEYRTELLPMLLQHTLQTALERAVRSE